MSIPISKRFVFDLASLWEVKQSISHSISFSLIIIDLEGISRKFLGPSDLTKAQIICIHELIEVVMISKDEKLVFAVFQVMAPSIEIFNNC